jgi:hypothetical protein
MSRHYQDHSPFHANQALNIKHGQSARTRAVRAFVCGELAVAGVGKRSQDGAGALMDYEAAVPGQSVAGLGEEDEKGLVGDGRLLRVGWIVHAY